MVRNSLLVMTAILLVVAVAGPAQALNEECAGCHGQRVADLAASSHNGLVCETCHENAANHGGNMTEKTTVHFDLEVCSGCHPDQYGTYTYGDDWKTQYGGSPGPDAVMPLPNGYPLLWNKLNDFAHYNDIIDGYGFTREYNEERSHNVMIQDHHDVSRGKKDTCLQCKSTKVAYLWDLKDSVGNPRQHEIQNTTTVQAGHMSFGVDIPKGTTVSMYTDRAAAHPNSHEVRLVVTLPNGTKYASYAGEPGADYSDPTLTGYMLWSALYALTVNELPAGSPTIASGNGCNHCHNPHKVSHDANGTTGFRLIRKSLIYAIENHGINPYDPGSPTSFDGSTALTMDEGIALCAQCHVEYVCGNSPIDKVDRDFFSWAKASDLEAVYSTEFPGSDDPQDPTYGLKYVQDWKHGTGGLSSPNSPGNGVPYLTPFPIEEELIKSQHPEAETYWGSRHYGNNAPCFLCHMPKVTKTTGETFTSHWLASPNKYMSPEPVGAFAAAFDLVVDRNGIISPCGECHGGKLSRMKDKAVRIQDGIYADALTVEAALVESLAAIKTAKDGAGDPALIDAAAEDHRAAHVRWENLVVSENSMGFHNPSEVSTELHNALSFAQSAKQKAEDALAGPCVPTGPEICTGGVDEDCDGLIDCADTADCSTDPACQVVDCSQHLDKMSCNADMACRWDNKNKVCISQ